MRWLLLKDLQILRRSPLQAVLLVAYPVLIAVLVGFAISRSPAKPRVAFLNEVPSDARVSVGTSQLPKIGVNDRICERVECVKVKSRAEAVDEVRALVPEGPKRRSLERVVRFTNLARDNLGSAVPLLARLTQPIAVDKEVVDTSTPPLETFAIAVAATLTLAFVTVLLVAGSLALEREENAYPRLVRGLVSRRALLGEKVLLGTIAGLAVTLLMLGALTPFVALHWSRLGLWLVAIAAGGASLAGAGAALGAAARDVRAVSLLAFMVTLPVALLSLVPSGAVGPALYDAIRLIAALFPFKPALQAIGGALDPAGPSIAPALLHLAILAGAYGLLARFALRRFSSV
jgi:hypothetical protein